MNTSVFNGAAFGGAVAAAAAGDATATAALTWATGAAALSPQHLAYARGESVRVTFRPAGAAVDVVGWALAAFLVRLQPGAEPLWSRATGDGIEVTDGPAGEFELDLPEDLTDSAAVPHGVYVLEVWRTGPGSADRLAYVYVTVAESGLALLP